MLKLKKMVRNITEWLMQKKPLQCLILALIILTDLLFAVWCCGAIWFQRWITSGPLKLLLVIAFALMSLGCIMGCFRKWILLPIGFLLSLAIATPWFILMQPTGKRDWQIPCSRIPTVAFSKDGKTVTIGNIRDFRYRTTEDYDVRYRTETYCLKDLNSLDYVIVFWMPIPDLIGHVMLSFGFADGRHLVISGETRIGRKDSKSLLAGIYRQYELIYILGTEEDLLQLRTSFRNQRVYLYPVDIKPADLPLLFTDLVQRAADLETQPMFYNTLRFNCTNSLAVSTAKLGTAFGTGITGMLNGINDRSAYFSGRLARRLENESFAEYKRRHFANQYIGGVKNSRDYSQRIRPELNQTVQKKMIR